MKKLIFILIIGFLAFYTKAQTHAVDTSGNIFTIKNLVGGEKWVMPKSYFYLSANDAVNRDNISIYTANNVSVYSGKLSNLQVPGAATLPQKLNFLVKNLSVSASTGGGGSSDAKESKQDAQITKAQNALDSIAKVIIELQKLRLKAQWKGDSIATFNQTQSIAKEYKQDLIIGTLGGIDAKLTWDYQQLQNSIKVFELSDNSFFDTKNVFSYELHNIGSSNIEITFGSGDLLTLQPSEIFKYTAFENPIYRQLMLPYNFEYNATSSTLRIIATFYQ